jgi:hypothetical protein
MGSALMNLLPPAIRAFSSEADTLLVQKARQNEHNPISDETQITTRPSPIAMTDPGGGVLMPESNITCERDARCDFEDSVAPKEQGRRRSMPSTTLPAPDIEIGSRHPVCPKMDRIRAGACDPFHSRA